MIFGPVKDRRTENKEKRQIRGTLPETIHTRYNLDEAITEGWPRLVQSEPTTAHDYGREPRRENTDSYRISKWRSRLDRAVDREMRTIDVGAKEQGGPLVTDNIRVEEKGVWRVYTRQ